MFPAVVAVISIVLVLCILYLLLIRPSSRRKNDAGNYAVYRFAHRGLHDDIFVENTVYAFLQAKESGYGIELDVRLTKDNQVVVFHDNTLQRAVGRSERVADLTYDELSGIPLFGTDAHIPLFSAVLSALKNTPILVELKCDTADTGLAEKTAALLDAYQGPYAIESFNPLILAWFKKNRPHVLRGQLVQRNNLPKSQSVFVRFILAHMLSNGIVRPDFLACNISETDGLTFRLCHLLYHPVLFGWTVKSDADAKIAEGIFDTIIFEQIRP